MKKSFKVIIVFILLLVSIITLTGCKSNSNVIRVCASELPHADILNNVVKEKLKQKGYTLEVTVLDWSLQNDAVANKDYDANYFQHVPYLNTYNGKTKLFATCKVHYEPLCIYYGKAKIELHEGKTFAICADDSNAIRALQLLYSKGVIEDLPVKDDKLTFSTNTWTSKNGIQVTLIAEELLAAALNDYDFCLLPCNTAYTAKIDTSRIVAKEDDIELLYTNANVLAAREEDYKNNTEYKNKIDALTDVLLSDEVSNYVLEKYGDIITCNKNTQSDLR